MTPPRMIALQTLRAVGSAFREYAQCPWALRIILFHYKTLIRDEDKRISALYTKKKEDLTPSERHELGRLHYHKETLVKGESRADLGHPILGNSIEDSEDNDRQLYFPRHDVFTRASMRDVVRKRIGMGDEMYHWHSRAAYYIDPWDHPQCNDCIATIATLSQMADKAMQGLFPDMSPPPLCRSLPGEILDRTPMVLHIWMPAGDGQWKLADEINLRSPGFGLWSETIYNVAEAAANAIELLVREVELAEAMFEKYPELYRQAILMPANGVQNRKKKRSADTETDTKKDFEKKLRSQRTKDAIAYVNAYRDRVAIGAATWLPLNDLVRAALDGESDEDIIATIRNLQDDRPASEYLHADIRAAQ